MVQTKEEIAIKRKEWYLKNKDKNKGKIAIKNKEYRLENKGKIAIKNKEYYVENHKELMINKWKKRGLKSEIYGAIYDYYKGVLNCERCSVTLTTGKLCKTRKCMDHCHQTGLFRDVICLSCNSSLPEQKSNPCKSSANTLEVVKEV